MRYFEEGDFGAAWGRFGERGKGLNCQTMILASASPASMLLALAAAAAYAIPGAAARHFSEGAARLALLAA